MAGNLRERDRTIVSVVCLCLLTIALVAFVRYARVHLRSPPKVNSCFVLGHGRLRGMSAVSGLERHEFEDGEVVYLRGPEDEMVRCAYQYVSESFAEKVAGALAFDDSAQRARTLLELVASVPQGRTSDPEAEIAWHVAAGALDAMPVTPEVERAVAIVEEIHDCRFRTDAPCPTRPPLPWAVPALGLPGLVGALWLVLRGIEAARRRRRASA